MKVVTERFDVEHEIGAGGMGTVFRARDRLDGGLVALKVLRRGSSADSQRFDREARVLADLTHPAIVRYVAHGLTEKGEPFLAMEWLEGEDLSTRLARGPMTPAETIQLGAPVGGALGAAHARGVVHRDIKPSNLFLPSGRLDHVKLLDFGVARWSRAAQAPTVTGTVLGTPAYMSPEQARGDKKLGPEADVFSLGCVLFECLTGHAPYAGENLMATLGRLILGDPPRVQDYRTDVPPALVEAVHRMMEKNPKRRPPNGDAVRELLEGLTRGEVAGAAARAARPDPSAKGALDEQPRSRVIVTRASERPPARASERPPARASERPPAASSRRPGRQRRSTGFAAAVNEAAKKPENSATLSDKIVVILSKYIPMPWAMFKAQCQRLDLDPSGLSTGDLPPLAEALVAAESRFTGPAERAAMRDDLMRLDELRRAAGTDGE